MNKFITKIVGAALGLTMAIGVGVAVGVNQGDSREVSATPTNAFSFTRSGSKNTVTSSYSMVLTNYKETADYYQDKNSSVGLDIGVKKTSGTIWSTTPQSISLTVKVGGGSAKDPLSNNVTANLIDSSGAAIENTSVTVTNKVETTTGKNYTVSVPVANNAAGIMVHHEKESSYNVRVYAISLSYEAGAAVTLTSIAVKTAPTLLTYYAGEYFDPTGLVITATYSDASTVDVDYASHSSDFTFSPATNVALEAGTDSVSITYGGKSTTQAITVNAARTLSSIAVTTAPTKTVYVEGETFDPTGMVVTATYSNATTKDVTNSCTFNPTVSTALTTSNNEIVISYTEGTTKQTSQAITVNKRTSVVFVSNVDKGSSTSQIADSITKHDVTISSTKAAMAAPEYRWYKDSTTTISISSGSNKISSILFEDVDGYEISNISPNAGSITGLRWNSATPVTSVSFSASAQARFTRIEVVYDNGLAHVQLAASDVNVEVSNSSTISVTNASTSATITGCSFVSASESIATVTSAGVVSGVAAGVTTITISKTATAEEDYFPCEIKVVVNGPVSIARANEIGNALENQATTEYEVILNGYIIDLDADGKDRAFTLSTGKVDAQSHNDIMLFFGANSDLYAELLEYVVLNGTLQIRGVIQKYNTTIELKDMTLVSYSDDAMTFAKASYEALQAHCNSGTQAITSEEWATLASNWNDVDSYSKVKLQGATASYAYSDDIAHWISRYTIITGARTDLAAFMAPAQGSSNVVSNNTSNTTALLIVVISSISLVAVSSYFVIRRRREN